MRILWCSVLSAVLLVSLTQANPVERSDDNGSAAASSPDSTENGYSLPKNVAPTAYTIVLEPHFADQKFSFNGQSAIDIIVSGSDTKQIVVHAVDLAFDPKYTNLVNVNVSTTLVPEKHSTDAEKQFLVIEFPQSIAAGAYTLNLKYNGILKEEAKGFYRSKRQIDGQEVWEAFTQFKPSYARLAFPCFDKTDMKAPFTIEIKQPKNYVTISTSLAIRDTNNGDKSSTELRTRENMSPDDIQFKVVYVEPVAPTPSSAAAAAASASPATSTAAAPASPATSTAAAPAAPASPATSTAAAPAAPASPATSTAAAPAAPASPATSTAAAPAAPASPATSTAAAPASPATSTAAAPASPATSTAAAPASPATSTAAAPASPATSTAAAPASPTTTSGPADPASPTSSPAGESSGSSTTDKSSGSSTTEGSSGSSTTEGSSGSSTTEGSSGSSTTEGSSGSSTTEGSGSSTTEGSGSSTTEGSGSSTTEGSGSSTTEGSAGDPTAAPSSPGAASISLPTLPLTIFTGLLVRLVAQAL